MLGRGTTVSLLWPLRTRVLPTGRVTSALSCRGRWAWDARRLFLVCCPSPPPQDQLPLNCRDIPKPTASASVLPHTTVRAVSPASDHSTPRLHAHPRLLIPLERRATLLTTGDKATGAWLTSDHSQDLFILFSFLPSTLAFCGASNGPPSCLGVFAFVTSFSRAVLLPAPHLADLSLTSPLKTPS